MLKIKKSIGKFLLGAAAAVIAATAGAFASSAFDADTLLLKEYEQPAREGCMNVGITGSYINEVSSIISRINVARYEACKLGVPDPNDPSRKLTLEDFVPIRYSSELERIARIRAAEATLTYGHTRPNGDTCFSIASDNAFSYHAESLAWNNSGTMKKGMDQFMKEKDSWVNQTPGAITGHYTQMINPNNSYVGIAAFKAEGTTGYSTALCIRYARSDDNLDATRGEAIENCVVPVQVPEDNFDSIRVKAINGKTVAAGDTASFEFRGTVSYEFKSGSTKSTWNSDVLLYKTEWNSSNTSVASIDAYGNAKAIKSGITYITATCDADALRFKLTVTPGIGECKITIPYSSYTYRGRGIRPSVTVKLGNEKLVKGTDYTIEYSNNIDVGTGTITVKGMGKYGGTAVKNFTIKPLDINSSYAKMSIPYASYSYTGKVITPKLKLKFKDGSVIPDTDYLVRYSSNINVGKAKIYVIGKGKNVTGSAIKEFVVKPAKNEIRSISTTTGAFRLIWTKASAGASGYQVLYSMDPKFSDDVHSYTSKDINDLTENFSKVPASGETWYVKVRSFVEMNNTRYGNYSDVRSIKVK